MKKPSSDGGVLFTKQV